MDFCEPNLNLLAHAQTIEIEVGSRCGGHGKCGGDRIRVREDSVGLLSPVTGEEERLISDIDRAQGFRLACQAFPESPNAEIHVELF